MGLARADGEFEVAKERCDDFAGQPKSLCLTQAKAARTKAEVDAKLATPRSARRKPMHGKTRHGRRPQGGAEKCEILAADAKGACLAEI